MSITNVIRSEIWESSWKTMTQINQETSCLVLCNSQCVSTSVDWMDAARATWPGVAKQRHALSHAPRAARPYTLHTLNNLADSLTSNNYALINHGLRIIRTLAEQMLLFQFSCLFPIQSLAELLLDSCQGSNAHSGLIAQWK